MLVRCNRVRRGTTRRVRLLFTDIRDDGREFRSRPILITGEPHIRQERFPVAAMPSALHRCPELRTVLPPQSVMEFGQEGSDRVADQMAVAWCHQFDRGPVGQLNEAALV